MPGGWNETVKLVEIENHWLSVKVNVTVDVVEIIRTHQTLPALVVGKYNSGQGFEETEK